MEERLCTYIMISNAHHQAGSGRSACTPFDAWAARSADKFCGWSWRRCFHVAKFRKVCINLPQEDSRRYLPAWSSSSHVYGGWSAWSFFARLRLKPCYQQKEVSSLWRPGWWHARRLLEEYGITWRRPRITVPSSVYGIFPHDRWRFCMRTCACAHVYGCITPFSLQVIVLKRNPESWAKIFSLILFDRVVPLGLVQNIYFRDIIHVYKFI